MKRLRIVIATALILAGCGSRSSSSSASLSPTSSSGTLVMSLIFDPSPAKQGNETISISLKDASGDPVEGAIVKATTNMPAMSMSGPALAFQDNGDGTYSAVANLNFRTRWVFDVSASSDDKSSKAQFVQDVK